MNTPLLKILFAWQTPYSHGATFETPEEAREDSDWVDSGAKLLRLYVDADGKIVHTEEVAS